MSAANPNTFKIKLPSGEVLEIPKAPLGYADMGYDPRQPKVKLRWDNGPMSRSHRQRLIKRQRRQEQNKNATKKER